MSTSRVNVLVYAGHGSTVDSVRHCLYTLRQLLAPKYAVIPVTGDMILKEPWTASCAALVFPGGADLGFARTLNGLGNRRIRQYVEQGGNYIGFCAGGYYGTKRCEFEAGNKFLEVIGDRELAFFPGTSRGCAFGGFVYNSEKGARAVELKINQSSMSSAKVPNMLRSYYNGGSVFVDASKLKDQGIEVLASYAEELSCESGEGAAAVIYCKVGMGAALLTGPHPEFAAANLADKPEVPGFADIKKLLTEGEHDRLEFLKACLLKLGLVVSDAKNVPSLSRIYLSACNPSDMHKVILDLAELITRDQNGEEVLKDENDTFHMVKPSTWSMADLGEAPHAEGCTTHGNGLNADDSHTSSSGTLDYNSIIKQLVIHDTDYPDVKTTPYFNHRTYYANLKHYHQLSGLTSPTFGAHLLYGEVVTSTNTMLEKNVRLLRQLPHGFTATATIQIAGRGRGSNVWVAPAGNLMFSTIIRHPISLLQSAPIVFVQYLAAIAVVQGIQNYDRGQYRHMPIKLKWPNDIFALDPKKHAASGDKNENYTKIGGILVNSHYDGSNFIAVCGIGLNVANVAATTSLNQLLPLLSTLSPHRKARSIPETPPPPPHFALEPLLASILTSFEHLYIRFLDTGFDHHLEQLYYKHWLHMDQIVTLETQDGARARIKGITRDHGLLIAEELGWEDRPTGKSWELMSDSNSFDFFKGLVKRKI